MYVYDEPDINGKHVNEELIPGLPDHVAAACLLRVDYTRINVFASVCNGWKQVFRSPDFLTNRRIAGVAQSFFAFSLVDKIICGLTNLNLNYIALFEPKSGQWSSLPHVPYDVRSPLEEYNLVQAGDKLVGIEMWSTSRRGPKVYVYDLAAGKWRKGRPCPISHWRIPAYASDGVSRVFLAGGVRKKDRDICLDPVSTAMSYDVDSDTWQLLPDMAEERNTCRGFFHQGVFHVLGGVAGIEGGAELYNVSSGRWTSLPEFAPYDSSHEIGRMAFLAPDGNYYRHHVDGTKLMRRQNGRWVFVGNLPAEVRDRNYWVPFAWEEGFVMARKLDDPSTDNILYTLPLKGDRNRNIPCQTLKMPSEYKGAIVSGCCLKA